MQFLFWSKDSEHLSDIFRLYFVVNFLLLFVIIKFPFFLQSSRYIFMYYQFAYLRNSKSIKGSYWLISLFTLKLFL